MLTGFPTCPFDSSKRAFLRGDGDHYRQELFSYVGTARILRTDTFLWWEVVDSLYNHPKGIVYRHFGHTDRDEYERVKADDPLYGEILAQLKERLDEYPKFDHQNPDFRELLIRYDGRPGRHGPSRVIGPRGELEQWLD